MERERARHVYVYVYTSCFVRSCHIPWPSPKSMSYPYGLARAASCMLARACVIEFLKFLCIVLFLYRTKKAMGGSVTFRESLRMRLNMIKPSRQQLQDFIESQNIEDVLTPGVTYVITRHCAWLIVVIISILL